MSNTADTPVRTPFPWVVAAGLIAVKLALHLATTFGDGFFRDEFYYLDCAHHLAWGYVDQPPFSIVVLAGLIKIFGESIWTLRIPIALVSASLIPLTGGLARTLGAGRYAQFLAMLCALCTQVSFVTGSFYSMNPWDQVFWLLASLVLVRILQGGHPRRWLLFGLVCGLGLMNKMSMGFFGAAIVVGLLATAHRRHFAQPWIYVGGAIAVVIFLPNILWQAVNGFPTLEFMHNVALYKNAGGGPIAYFFAVLLALQPVLIFVWAPGLWHALRHHVLRPFGIAFILLFLIFAFGNGKEYYLAPAAPWLYVAGALFWERILATRPRIRWGVAGVIAASTLLVLPITLRVLPPEIFVRYQAALGIAPYYGEQGKKPVLPQYLGDRYGWDELAKLVEDAYLALPQDVRARVVLFARNYGEAGALNHHRRRGRAIPPVISGHNNHYLWGYGDASNEVVLVFGAEVEELREGFAEVTPLATLEAEWAMPYEQGKTLYLCREPKVPLEQLWPQLRMII